MWSAILGIHDRPDLAAILEAAGPPMRPDALRSLYRWARLFRRFCRAYGLEALPAQPETVLRFIAALCPHYRPKTIRQMLRPISILHRQAGLFTPTAHPLVCAQLEANDRAGPPVEHYRPLAPEAFVRLMTALPRRTPQDLRVRAVAAVAFWGMIGSRVELADLRFENRTIEPDRWTFAKVGTRRRTVLLDRADDPDLCPLAELDALLATCPARSGPLLRQRYGSPVTYATLSYDVVCLRREPGFEHTTLRNLAAVCLEAAYHAGVDFPTLVLRAGLYDQRELERRLRQIVTFRPTDRPLPPPPRPRIPWLRRPRGRLRQRRRDL